MTGVAAAGRPAGAGGRRRRNDRLAPAATLEEAALALGRSLAGDGAEHAPAAPLERPAAQRVGLEADQQVEGEAGERDPARVDGVDEPHQLENAATIDIAEQRPPQPVHEEPDRREQGRLQVKPSLMNTRLSARSTRSAAGSGGS